MMVCVVFLFQAEDGIRDLVRSRGLGDVYKRQSWGSACRCLAGTAGNPKSWSKSAGKRSTAAISRRCLLYTSDAADERSSVDLGGRRIIKKKQMYNLHIAVNAVNTTRTLVQNETR